MRMWTEFKWLSIVTVGGILWKQ